jgi:hypothetical protein
MHKSEDLGTAVCIDSWNISMASRVPREIGERHAIESSGLTVSIEKKELGCASALYLALSFGLSGRVAWGSTIK